MTEPSQHNHPRRNLLGGTVSRPPGPSLWKNQPLESGSATDRSRLLQLLQFLFQTQLLLLFILQSHAIATGKKRCYICVPPPKKWRDFLRAGEDDVWTKKKSGDLANNGVVYSRHAQKCRSSSFSTRFWCLYLNLWDINALEDIYPWPSSTNKKLANKCKKRTFKNYTVTKKINCGDG